MGNFRVVQFLRNFAVNLNPRKLKSANYFPVFETISIVELLAYMVAVCGSYLLICGKTSNMQLSKNSLSLQAIWLAVNWSMNHLIYSMSRWLIFFYCCIWHTFNCFSFLLNRMFAFMLHSEYTTSCFMAKSVIWHDFHGSCHKQAGQTFHCFVLTVIFFNRLNENMFFLFVSSIFYFLRFWHFGWRFPLRTVDLSRESRVLPPTRQFLRTRIKIIFRGRCQPRKLKSAKNKLHVF